MSSRDPDPYVSKILLGKYRCLEKIGEGTSCRAYKVQHAKLAGLRAMKVLRPELKANAAVVDAFWREARVASSLRHPNIVILHDVDALPDATPCSIWEHIEGETLGRRVGRAPLRAEAAGLARGLCGALQDLHDRGLAHLGIYPDNILLTATADSSHDPRLIGFGEARPIGAAPAGVAGQVRLGFTAPEQLDGGAAVDARADVFALGAILCFAVTGEPPLRSPDLETYRQALKHLEPAKLDCLTKLPPALASIVERCLAPDPQDRFEDAAAVRDAIRREARGGPGSSDMATSQDGLRVAPVATVGGPHDPPAARLESQTGDRRGPISIGSTATVGRIVGNTVLIDHPTVSKRHARIYHDNGEYYIEDLGSRNGSSVNGNRVMVPSPLRHGDTVAVGDVVLRFYLA